MKRLALLAVIVAATGLMAIPVFGEVGTKDNGDSQIKNV